ncbi:MAG: DUF456 domain-containing protein [Chloroflexota bacterium]|nr:DUF456 domain-containing protein [Chloroflexota bacterium]
MDLLQGGLTVAAVVLMIIVFFLSFLPVISGPLMLWGVALVYGILTGFAVLTPPAMIVITVLMVMGVTADYWLPLVGVKTEGASCGVIFGTIIGGLIGTFALPIPLVGTLVGSIAGAVLMQLMYVGNTRDLLKAGQFAVRTYFIGMALEFVFNAAIMLVFFVVVIA